MSMFDDSMANGTEFLDISVLSNDTKLRLNALKNLDIQHSKLHLEFLRELSALERAYQLKYQPLFDQRAEIVNGTHEPSEQETKVPDNVPDYTQLLPQQGQTQQAGPVKGIPSFWLTCMLFHPHIGAQITDSDKPLLNCLTDIKVSYLETNPGFSLTFCFRENEYITNPTLVKTYYLSEIEEYTMMGSGLDTEYVFDKTESTSIEWKEGMDLTVKVEMRKQRHKESNKTRVVKRTVPTDSFFNFFKSLATPTENMDEDLEAQLEFDYQIGEEFKDKIIPQALAYFTGEADLGMDSEDEDMDSMDMDSEDEEE